MEKEDAIALAVAKLADGKIDNDSAVKILDEFAEKYNLTTDEIIEIIDTAEELIGLDNSLDEISKQPKQSELEEKEKNDDSVFEDYTKDNATNRLAKMLSNYRW